MSLGATLRRASAPTNRRPLAAGLGHPPAAEARSRSTDARARANMAAAQAATGALCTHLKTRSPWVWEGAWGGVCVYVECAGQ